MCSYQDTEYWFVTFQENQGDDTQGQWFRRYAVLALTVEQLAKEHQVHQDFQTYVGDAATSRRPQDQWHVFYDKHLEFVRSARFDENEVVAWFEL